MTKTRVNNGRCDVGAMFPTKINRTKIYQGALFSLFTNLWNHPPTKTDIVLVGLRTFHNKKNAQTFHTLAHVDRYFTGVCIYGFARFKFSNKRLEQKQTSSSYLVLSQVTWRAAPTRHSQWVYLKWFLFFGTLDGLNCELSPS